MGGKGGCQRINMFPLLFHSQLFSAGPSLLHRPHPPPSATASCPPGRSGSHQRSFDQTFFDGPSHLITPAIHLRVDSRTCAVAWRHWRGGIQGEGRDVWRKKLLGIQLCQTLLMWDGQMCLFVCFGGLGNEQMELKA